MRIHWIAAIAALFMLGGCNSGNDAATQQQVTPAIAEGTAITGTITLREPIEVAAGVLDVKLVDVATPELPVAEKKIDVKGMPPYTFTLDFDRTRIAPARTYVINALLKDGERRFLPSLNAPVLTHGAGISTEIVLVAEPTAAERAKEDYKKLQGQIGGMRKVEGTYTTDTASIGWDAFVRDGAVAYVRVNTVFDEGGRKTVHYAFRDGKPFAVEERRGASVGWDQNGKLLWNEKSGGGLVDEADIEAMRAEAERVRSMAQEKFDASRKK